MGRAGSRARPAPEVALPGAASRSGPRGHGGGGRCAGRGEPGAGGGGAVRGPGGGSALPALSPRLAPTSCGPDPPALIPTCHRPRLPSSPPALGPACPHPLPVLSHCLPPTFTFSQPLPVPSSSPFHSSVIVKTWFQANSY